MKIIQNQLGNGEQVNQRRNPAISQVPVELEIQVHLNRGPVEQEIPGPGVIPAARSPGRGKNLTAHPTRIQILRLHGTNR